MQALIFLDSATTMFSDFDVGMFLQCCLCQFFCLSIFHVAHHADGQLTPEYATQLGGQMQPIGLMVRRLLGVNVTTNHM